MKHILNLLFISAIAVTTYGQSFDKERMHRDLEVAENALNTVLESNSNDLHKLNIRSRDIEAGFVKDYGVIFTVSTNGFGHIKVYEKAKAKAKKKKSKATLKGIAKIYELESKMGLNESADKEKENFIENSKMFLADYAGIVGQLDDNHRISIRMGGSDTHRGILNLEHVYLTNSNSDDNVNTIWAANSGFSAESEIIIEATVGNISSLRKGNMSREAFYKTVSVVENEMSYDKDPDLETLSAMFHRLYKKDLSNTYYSERMPKYSKLSNFGVIVKMKFYSSYEDNHVYSMPTIDKEDLTLVERNNHVMELLPKFEADFKDNLVNYGRTLKNLDSDEILLFEINMTTCKDCKDFPRTMKFSIKKSVLHKYNRGGLSMKQAVELVNVDRIL